MNRIYIIILLVFFFCFSTVTWGEEKPSLTVKFEIKKEAYRDNFPQEIGNIEKKCTQKIIEALNSYFNFMNFTEDQTQNILYILLDDNEPDSSSPMVEVGFIINLKNSHVPSKSTEVYWKFRAEEDYDRTLGTSTAFIKEISDAFKRRLYEQPDLLVTRLLSKIIITSNALPIPKELMWVLPFKKTDLGVENESRFRIIVEFYRDPIGTIGRKYEAKIIGEYAPRNIEVPLPYYLGIITEALSEQEHLDEIKKYSEMNIKGIFIIEYIPYDNPLKPASSEEKEERR